MRGYHRTRTATVPLVVALLASLMIAGCSSGPSDEDWLEFVHMAAPELVDIEIDSIFSPYRANGWVAVKGTAVLGENLYRSLTPYNAAGLCDNEVEGYDILNALKLHPEFSENNPDLLIAGPQAGTPVRIDMEFVPKRAVQGGVDSDGDVLSADRVTRNGWTYGAVKDTYTIEGVQRYYAGRPESWYKNFGSTTQVRVGSDEFAQLCEKARGLTR